MSLAFIDDKQKLSWQDITTEERFFCSHLYYTIINREKEFVAWLYYNTTLKLNLNSNWEVGYEVCFYRDLIKYWKKRGIRIPKEEKYSSKRTFDLCLFSDDHIVLIEAKAQQGFHGKQLDEFEKDKKAIKDLLDTQGFKVNVDVVLLHSSSYHPKNNLPKVKWLDLYDSFCKSELFLKADQLYNK